MHDTRVPNQYIEVRDFVPIGEVPFQWAKIQIFSDFVEVKYFRNIWGFEPEMQREDASETLRHLVDGILELLP